ADRRAGAVARAAARHPEPIPAEPREPAPAKPPEHASAKPPDAGSASDRRTGWLTARPEGWSENPDTAREPTTGWSYADDYAEESPGIPDEPPSPSPPPGRRRRRQPDDQLTIKLDPDNDP
ncbi:MAG: hypothetical protein M3Z06_04400, partial [Actinomycetota bacterium]|nr:hypothetical protein [Actinomycetota bacterium]